MTGPAEAGPSTTVLVSRSPDADSAAKAREEEAIEAILAGAPGRVVVVPHAYHLPEGHPLWERLRAGQGELVVLSAMYPRAARWLLVARGVLEETAEGPSRAVTCIRWDDQATPSQLAQTVSAAVGAEAVGHGDLLRLDQDEPQRRWYPVIDYERCSSCGQCREFCMFGVYERSDTAVEVRNPDYCKAGCPACARMCPSGSIMFPDCGEPVIAGAAPEAGAPREQPGPDKPAMVGGGDELEDLIAALDELDV